MTSDHMILQDSAGLQPRRFVKHVPTTQLCSSVTVCCPRSRNPLQRALVGVSTHDAMQVWHVLSRPAWGSVPRAQSLASHEMLAQPESGVCCVMQVSVAALPPQVSVPIAESILFIGKAVRVLQQPPGAARRHALLPQSDVAAFSGALHRLQQQQLFNQMEFERTVEAIRTKVTGAQCMPGRGGLAWQAMREQLGGPPGISMKPFSTVVGLQMWGVIGGGSNLHHDGGHHTLPMHGSVAAQRRLVGLQAWAGRGVEVVCTKAREHDKASVPTDAKECNASATKRLLQQQAKIDCLFTPIAGLWCPAKHEMMGCKACGRRLQKPSAAKAPRLVPCMAQIRHIDQQWHAHRGAHTAHTRVNGILAVHLRHPSAAQPDPGAAQPCGGAELQQLPLVAGGLPSAALSLAQSRTSSTLDVQVAGQLWQLVVVHDELPLHLAALKDYFLLSKGDFYQAFLLEVGA